MPERQALDTNTRITLLERSFDQLQKRVDRHSELSQDIAILKTEFHSFSLHMDEKFKELEKKFTGLEHAVESDVSGLRKTLISTGASVLIAAIGFAITTLVVFGGPG